jgi:RNA polymerase sigma factor (sigma-70 family)
LYDLGSNTVAVVSVIAFVAELTLAVQMTASQREFVEAAYKRDRQKLLGFIRKRVPSSEDAEDLLQDVFYSLGTQVEPISEVTNWLFRVARNRIIDWYRKKRTVAMPRFEDEDSGAVTFLAELLPSGDDPNSEYMRQEIWEELEAALGELPAPQREAFVLHELEGFSFKQMAEMTGVPLNTLLTRKHYAVGFLRERLQDVYDSFNNS